MGTSIDKKRVLTLALISCAVLAGPALSAGGFHFLPGKVHHYAFTKVPTVIQVNTNGPFDMTYINPDDDPQKAKK